MIKRNFIAEEYVAPELEVLLTTVEEGFTTSFGDSTIDGAGEDEYGPF